MSCFQKLPVLEKFGLENRESWLRERSISSAQTESNLNWRPELRGRTRFFYSKISRLFAVICVLKRNLSLKMTFFEKNFEKFRHSKADNAVWRKILVSAYVRAFWPAWWDISWISQNSKLQFLEFNFYMARKAWFAHQIEEKVLKQHLYYI